MQREDDAASVAASKDHSPNVPTSLHLRSAALRPGALQRYDRVSSLIIPVTPQPPTPDPPRARTPTLRPYDPHSFVRFIAGPSHTLVVVKGSSMGFHPHFTEMTGQSVTVGWASFSRLTKLLPNIGPPPVHYYIFENREF